MSRSRLLAICVLLVFSFAVTMRVRSHMQQWQQRETLELPAPSQATLALPLPRDYVVNPYVVPTEADAGPARIISLAPNITETLCALGLRDRIVGRTQYCEHPPGIEQVPSVGALMDTHFAKIQALEPDLVFTTANSERVIESLEALNLKHASVPHDSLEDLFLAIEQIGHHCQRPQTAAALSAAIQAELRTLSRAARKRFSDPMQVLICIGQLPVPPDAVWVAGPDSFLDSLLRLAGHHNASSGVLKASYGQLSLATLAAMKIDAILTFSNPLQPEAARDLYQQWSQLEGINAIQQRQVLRVGGKQWQSAGPRVAIALHHFIRVLSCVD